ncbi:WXG100 family type VII secretion target [Nocardia sp. NEAU-G5]|uniref:ESAT-6-like protein n=1 Tax=Nocardia albiluteola TaxID=2842303 RepID=A0ABS6B6P4_9NOCA|nr:WXG100 family type VII secretion target [Nocardia albiluteola]MBU3065401.1 WXG100 family type VII secretion target [Nocardia albiluteola]
MATQYLDFATFQKYANAYAAVIDPINKTVDQLRSSVEAAKSGWQGTAYSAFNSFATELEAQITKVNKDLTQVSEALNSGEKTVATSDDESTSGFTSLATSYS